jgi:hypothetical protein
MKKLKTFMLLAFMGLSLFTNAQIKPSYEKKESVFFSKAQIFTNAMSFISTDTNAVLLNNDTSLIFIKSSFVIIYRKPIEKSILYKDTSFIVMYDLKIYINEGKYSILIDNIITSTIDTVKVNKFTIGQTKQKADKTINTILKNCSKTINKDSFSKEYKDNKNHKLNFGQTIPVDSLPIHIAKIELNLNKYYKQYKLGTIIIGSGIAFSALGIGLTTDKKIKESVYTTISIIGSVAVLTGLVIRLDAHKYFGRVAKVSVSPTGVKLAIQIN